MQEPMCRTFYSFYTKALAPHPYLYHHSAGTLSLPQEALIAVGDVVHATHRVVHLGGKMRRGKEAHRVTICGAENLVVL